MSFAHPQMRFPNVCNDSNPAKQLIIHLTTENLVSIVQVSDALFRREKIVNISESLTIFKKSPSKMPKTKLMYCKDRQMYRFEVEDCLIPRRKTADQCWEYLLPDQVFVLKELPKSCKPNWICLPELHRETVSRLLQFKVWKAKTSWMRRGTE